MTLEKFPVILLSTMLIVSIGHNSWAADIKRTAFSKQEAAAPENFANAAKMVSVDNLIFLSGVYGTKANALDQVDEVVEKMHARLAEKGLGFGNMLQHTIFVKNGAAPPIEVLNRFHAAATRLAPSLKTLRSVGTIVRVPAFHNPSTVIMLDMVAGVPHGQDATGDGYARIPFVFGPQEIVESIADKKLLFTAGLEAFDFEHGTLVPTIEEQIQVIAGKLDNALKKAGLSPSHIVQHNLYVTKGTDPTFVISKFQEEIAKRDPGTKTYPSVDTVMVVDGMAAPGFLLEMDAIASRVEPADIKRVPFPKLQGVSSRSASTGDMIYLSAMPGIDFANNMRMKQGLDAQIEQAVKNTQESLQKCGLTLANLVKVRLAVKMGAGDPIKAREKFYEMATRYAPALKSQPPAETLLVVEGLTSDDRLFEVTAIGAK